MSSFLHLCQQRASVRTYTSVLPEETDIQYVVECFRVAPSAVNKQPWHIFYITSPKLLEQLRTTYPRTWFATAPAVFVICKDENAQWVRSLDNHPHGDIDIAIATEHLCLAATERGLATCWVCYFDVERCREILQLPTHLTPAVMIPIGYAAPDFEDAGRKRKDTAEIFTHLK